MARLLSFFVALGATAGLFAASPTRPNLVIFLADDHSMLDSAVYGAKDVKTPNMQRIAQAGLVFERAFVASPSCAPSRGAMLTTGEMATRLGIAPKTLLRHKAAKKIRPAVEQGKLLRWSGQESLR